MIRKGERKDLESVMGIFEEARRYMRRSGNLVQWVNGYPREETVIADMDSGCFYVEENDGEITGCFAFAEGEEPTYKEIDGAWLDDNSYGTIHRLASNGKTAGFGTRCIEYCKGQVANLRADTHADNLKMQRILESNGFIYCGIIHVSDGTPRLAYQSPAEKQT